jgi:hypothetical protein
MAITKRTVVLDLRVEADGQVVVFEQDEYWEGAFDTGVLETISPRRGRKLDVGDDVTSEDILVKDTVNGNLHSQARQDARDAARGQQ